jgi:lysozyme
MDLIELKDQLIQHEGLRLHPYRCPAGKLTIGCGRNLEDRGISRDEAMLLLTNDIREAADDVVNIIGMGVWDRLTDARQRVLVDMRFNLGPGGFRGFKRMIQAVRDQRWEDAANEMIDSNWARQVTSRANRLAAMMREG